ncbi:MAG: hypothetical protein ACK5TR_07225 [Alphaproteobacteria bacterium]|nr:hypothetical protein [Alphaproteobacteria bacterium]
MGERVRCHGSAPYGLALVHGGPGAAGDLAPLAHALAKDQGVLEPLQRAISFEGQVEELAVVLTSIPQPLWFFWDILMAPFLVTPLQVYFLIL